jgi:hypothetical protein
MIGQGAVPGWRDSMKVSDYKIITATNPKKVANAVMALKMAGRCSELHSKRRKGPGRLW